MAAGPLHKTLEPLRQLAAAQFFAGWPDRELLGRFLAERDQAAFAELVHRHRRLVCSLCRHLLGHEQDAEDAFQATFLVLALKGGAIRKRASLASWLHGVAYRCAMQIKRQQIRRQRREREIVRDLSYDPARETNVRELAALLQIEVQRLPEKHRAPFVLCCLEGKSQEEAARELGWKTGTVSGRLARARQELQRRLGRMGVHLPAALAAAAIGEAEVSAAVLSATVRGGVAVQSGAAVMCSGISPKVLTLVKGVSQAMFLSKIKTAAVVVLLASLLAGVGLSAQQAACKNGAAEPKQAADEPRPEPPRTATEPEKNQNLRFDGKPFEYWRDFATNELKPERRVEAIRAMGAFGVRGYAKEATEVIVNLMKEYQNADDFRSAANLIGNSANGTPDQRVVAEAYASLYKIGAAAAPVLLQNLGPENLRLFAVVAFRQGVVDLPKSSLPALLRIIAEDKKKLSSAALDILAPGQAPTEETWQAVSAFATTDANATKFIRALTQIVADNPPVSGGPVFTDMWFPRDVAAYLLGRMGERARAAARVLAKAALQGQSKQALEAVLQVKADPSLVVPLAIAALKEKPNGNLKPRWAAAKLLAGLGPAAEPAIPALMAAISSSLGEHDQGAIPLILMALDTISAVQRGSCAALRPDRFVQKV